MAKAAARICLDHDGTSPEMMTPSLTLRSSIPDSIMASAPGKCNCSMTEGQTSHAGGAATHSAQQRLLIDA